MYQQNQNNSKGLHAQVNKQCLIAMQNDSGDGMNSGTNHMQYLSELINNQTHSQLLSRVTPNLPTKFSLEQNYPNPFNPMTKIKYQLPNNANVTIKIYDISGREVRTLVSEYKKAGYYDVSFDGSNLASGVYFYRIEAGTFTDSKKMVLIK